MTLLDGPAITASLKLGESTLRVWANRGLLTDHGHDSAGRRLYDTSEVLARVRAREVKSAVTFERSTTGLPAP